MPFRSQVFCRSVPSVGKHGSFDAALAYRITALECGFSPAELLLGRQLRTSIPVLASTLQPRWQESRQLQERRVSPKRRQIEAYDRQHRARPLAPLYVGNPVWVQDARTGGTVVGQAGSPRSYLVQTPTSCLRRNRRHLVPTPNEQPVCAERATTATAESSTNDETRPRSSSHERATFGIAAETGFTKSGAHSCGFTCDDHNAIGTGLRSTTETRFMNFKSVRGTPQQQQRQNNPLRRVCDRCLSTSYR